MYIGVDYYPEHWPKERWATDARLMQEAGFNVVRLAEFAWIFLEPEEGRFTFDLLDEAITLLGQHGISVVLGTPTAAMPAWAPRKYPEVMAMDAGGRRVTWGVRKNNCFSSGTYRLLSERITRAMAGHYAETPNVIGWQTDNEFGGQQCFCPSCRADFQDWLRAKYGGLEALNAAWGTHFWGQHYGAWGEIQLPDNPETQNPSLCLDWKRYHSWAEARFQHDQVAILRACCPAHFVTHNMMGLYSELDYYQMAEDLDFVSWDNYPVWGRPTIPVEASAGADLMRGIKGKNFWIMEQTAGPGGWSSFGRNPRPGEIRKICYQQLAHGADAQVWFRWRACTAGREQYWHGLLGHDGKPLRRYREAAQVAREYHALAAELEGTTLKPAVAFIYDYESHWALSIQPGFAGNSYREAMLRYYRACFRAGVNVDLVPPTADLAPYRAVIAPDLYLLPDALAQRLRDYVANGGVLLTDCRTGVKTETNLCHDRTLPGLLSDVLGITIEEYDSIEDGQSYPIASPEGEYTAVQYVDWLTPQGAESLATYRQWHLEAFAAATRHRFGRGAAFYVGAVVQEQAFYDGVMAQVFAAAGVSPLLAPPEGVEVSVREGNGRRLLFLVNHTEEMQTVPVPAGVRDLLGGRETGEALTLDRYGVAILQLGAP